MLFARKLVLFLASMGLSLACTSEKPPDGIPVRRDVGPRSDANVADGSALSDGASTDAGPTEITCSPYETATQCPDRQRCAVGLQEADGGTALAFRCTAFTENRREGDACRFQEIETNILLDNCSAGLFCYIDMAGQGSCRTLCNNESFCGPAEQCHSLSGDPAVGICETEASCNPVEQTGCDEKAASCYLTQSTDGWMPSCMVLEYPKGMGPGSVGAVCDIFADCAPELACIVTGARGECRQLCHTEADCDKGLACMALDDGEGLGTCQ